MYSLVIRKGFLLKCTHMYSLVRSGRVAVRVGGRCPEYIYISIILYYITCIYYIYIHIHTGMYVYYVLVQCTRYEYIVHRM